MKKLILGILALALIVGAFLIGYHLGFNYVIENQQLLDENHIQIDYDIHEYK